MVDIGIFTKNVDIKARAGINANDEASSYSATDIYVKTIEATVNTMTRYNWSDDFSGLSNDVSGVLTDVSANMCAMKVIVADMNSYTSRSEAQTMLDFLNNEVNRGLSVLKNKVVQTFMLGAT